MTHTYAGIGSREIPWKEEYGIKTLAKTLGATGLTCRSGGAKGTDSAFVSGAINHRTQVMLPWNGYNGLQVDHDHLLMNETTRKEALSIASRHHPNWRACSPAVKTLTWPATGVTMYWMGMPDTTRSMVVPVVVMT